MYIYFFVVMEHLCDGIKEVNYLHKYEHISLKIGLNHPYLTILFLIEKNGKSHATIPTAKCSCWRLTERDYVLSNGFAVMNHLCVAGPILVPLALN